MLKKRVAKIIKSHPILGSIMFGIGSVLWVASMVVAVFFPDAINSISKLFNIASSWGAVLIVAGAVFVSCSDVHKRDNDK